MAALLSTALTSATLAAGVAIGATVAIEKFGGRLGGLLATLPTTVVPASYGFAMLATQETDLAQSLGAVPLGMLVNVGFLACWRYVPHRLPAWPLRNRLAVMTLVSLTGWALGALLSLFILEHPRLAQHPLTAGACFTLIQVLVGTYACLQPLPAPTGSRPVPVLVLMGRGLLAGAAIAMSVVLAQTGGMVLGGLASVFPAIFLTTMISLWVAQGEAVPAGAVGPMMLGSASVSAYALLAAMMIPRLGFGAGAAVAWTSAVLVTSVPAWQFLRYRQLHHHA